MKQVTPGAGSFVSRGYNVNSFDRGPQMKLQTKYQRTGPSTFSPKDLFFLKVSL